MGYETDHYDPIIVFIICDKLDTESRKYLELNSSGTSYPTLVTIKAFLEQRCRALEATSQQKSKAVQKPSSTPSSTYRQPTKTYQVAVKPNCPVCKSEHSIYQCNEFSKLDVKARSDKVKKLYLCFNCLRPNHSARECKSGPRCQQCSHKHSTLLHSSSAEQPTAVVKSHYSEHKEASQVLLSTAVVKVKDFMGNMQLCRVLMDIGSQSSLISEACVKRLGLRRSRATIAIKGIGQSGSGNSQGMVNLVINSTISSFMINVEALVLPKLTCNLPNTLINISDWTCLTSLKLADPDFNTPGLVDILIGADTYELIVGNQKIIGSDGIPTARSTEFGWILSGRVDSSQSSHIVSHVSISDVSDQLKTFWELEEVCKQQHRTADGQECESHFQKTFSRDSTGHFVVTLPLKQDEKQIGLSKVMCMKRLIQVEKRLDRHPIHKEQYHNFMDQYLLLGHMMLIHTDEVQEIPPKTNYLPHHFVLKESSTTTSFRVVFDASAKTSTGVSLNDTMIVGPKLQQDIYTILLRFRMYKYAFTADIAKMYRQVKVTAQDADRQRILWRKNPSDRIQEFKLTTVTYGTASAPYLATKALQQLADEESHRFPLAKEITMRDFYVDDVMSGSNSLEIAMNAQRELIDMLQCGGFELRKWSSNHSSLLDSLTPEYRESNHPLLINEDDSIKALGLHWSPYGDFFFFRVNLPLEIKAITKRNILYETARLYGPLGWLSPVIVIAKILLQRLWLNGEAWDEPLPASIESTWKEFCHSLFELEELRLNRIVSGDDTSTHQIHGFCDASEKAYSAVVFIRSSHASGNVSVHLITSKTKVAPIKKVSLPRLELCGAVLLARLITKVKSSLNTQFESIYMWTDSTITLAWISHHPGRWTTFVANRVSEIQSLTTPSCWHHVPSEDNPADCASRGMLPNILLNFSLWWIGPDWLVSDEAAGL